MSAMEQHGACTSGMRRLRRTLGPDYGADAPIRPVQILDSNGLKDALWALRAMRPEGERDRLVRLLACDYAEHVAHLADCDDGCLTALLVIHVAREYTEGRADDADLAAARAAARAAGAAARAAGAAERAWQEQRFREVMA